MTDTQTYHLRHEDECGAALCGASTSRLTPSTRFADCADCLRLHIFELERRITAPVHRVNWNGQTRCGAYAPGSREATEVTCPKCLHVMLEERAKQNQAGHLAQNDASRRLKRLKRNLRSLLQADDRGESSDA